MNSPTCQLLENTGGRGTVQNEPKGNNQQDLCCGKPCTSYNLVFQQVSNTLQGKRDRKRLTGTSLAVQWLRIPLAMQETQEMLVRSLDQEDPLEEEMGAHFSILA